MATQPGLLASFAMNTDVTPKMGAEQSGGPTVLPADVPDVAVMVGVTAPAGCDGLGRHPASLGTDAPVQTVTGRQARDMQYPIDRDGGPGGQSRRPCSARVG